MSRTDQHRRPDSALREPRCSGQAPAGSRRRSRPPWQAQDPTFKAQVDYVEVDAVVTDARGNSSSAI